MDRQRKMLSLFDEVTGETVIKPMDHCAIFDAPSWIPPPEKVVLHQKKKRRTWFGAEEGELAAMNEPKRQKVQ